MAWTAVRTFPQLLLASLLWGFASTLPSLSTQAAMTWIWGHDVAGWMQLNNAAFGVGSLLAPAIISLELRERNSFHWSYWGIGVANVCVAFMPFPFPTPRPAAERAEPEPALEPEPEPEQLVWRSASEGVWVDGEAVPLQGVLGKMLRAIDVDTSSPEKWRPQLNMWLVFYPWFMIYVASEIGYSAWIAPFATLQGLASEADAALLTTVYYSAFAATRVLSAPLSRVVSSRRMLWVSLLASMLAMLFNMLVNVDAVGKATKVSVLWAGAAAFGGAQGPLWPAMMSVLTEEFGLQLRTTHTSLCLVMSKMGIAFEQLVLSSLLADSSTAQWFMPANFALLLIIAAAQALLFFWALPQSGLSKAERHAPDPAETP